MLAGEANARHPIYGDDLRVKLTDGKLVLSGEVPTRRDRDQLVRKARARIGNGIHQLDVSGLKTKPRKERPGVLYQTLLAAFDHPDTADLVLGYMLEHSGTKPMLAQVVDRHTRLDDVLPAELVDKAGEQLKRGRTLIAVEVDETEAFRARQLLEEDTRSLWTLAAPPHVMPAGRR